MTSNKIFDFINWYVYSKEGNGSNYIKNNCNGDEEQFQLNVIDYAIQYAISYGHNPFEVDKNKIPELISIIKNNLYSSKTETSFKKYSEGINRHMPKAILGKENYLKYLSIINQQEEYTLVADSVVETKNTETVKVYTKEELVGKFFFRLTTQDRFYNFLYFPISVIKKLFYKNTQDREFFDKWMKEQINTVKFHTKDQIVCFSDITSLGIRNNDVYIKTNSKEFQLYTPIAGKKTIMMLKANSLQNLVIDHINPLETILSEVSNQLTIMKGIHKILIKFNDGRGISNRKELTTPGNMFVEKIRFSEQNIIDLKSELNLISSKLTFQIMDKQENLYKKKFD